MIAYLSNRMLQCLIVLAVMSFAIYGLIGLMPGDPIDLMISTDPRLTPEDAARLRSLYGLDQPISERYLAWASDALRGEFGYSRLHSKPVLDVIGNYLGNTLILMGLSFVLSIAIALPLGIIAAIRPRTMIDNTINLLCFAGISVPAFWLALMMIMLFAVTLGWLPPGGVMSPGEGGFWDRAEHAVLPVLTLTLASVGSYIRFVRASMVETLRQDYVRTARAKGALWPRILVKHALRNALIPVVTIIALQFGQLFSGALITEIMFAYLGMGKMIYDAILGNDYNLALVGLLIATLLTLIGNLIADLAYAWLDPRIAYR